MKKNLIWLVLVFTVILVGVFSLIFFKENYDYKRYETKSGIKIFSTKDESLPFIRYDVRFPRAGSDYSFEDKSGLAALTAYLLDQGAGGLSSEQIQEELNLLGTELDIKLWGQTVQLSLSGLSWHKDKLLDLFKKIVISPHFKEKELEILRQKFLTKRKFSLDRPSFVANAFMRKSLFKGMLGEPSSGDLLSLSKINLEDIKSFYKSQYKEGNPIFSLIGNFDSSFEKEFYNFVDENFSKKDLALAWQKPEPASQKAQFQLLTKPALVQAEVHLFYFLFPFPKDDFKSFLSLHLANFILGGHGMSSRLWDELREKRGLTYGVYSSPNIGKIYGFFDISGATKNSSVKELIEQILLNLKRIKKEGVSLEELNQAKNRFRVNHLKSIETPENNLSRVIYYTEYLGLSPKTWNRYLEILGGISLEEVNGVFDKFVLSDKSDRLKDFTNPNQDNDKAYLNVLVYGDPSLQSQLEGIEDLPPVEVLSFEDYFKKELSFQKKPKK